MNLKTTSLLVLLAAVLLAGCADDLMSLEIRQTCFPTDDCTFGATCDLQYLGTYSQSGTSPLRVYFEVANQVPNNSDATAGRANSNDAHVTGAIIDFSGANSGSYTVPSVANQLVPADGTAVIGITIPAGGTGNVTAKIRLVGYYDNGREFESGEYPFNYVAGATIVGCGATEVQVCPPPPVSPALGARYQLPSVCAAP